jgi:hypothetical protein
MAYLRKNVGTVTGIVTQEELDDTTTDVRQDVNILALREAVTENRVAYTSPNSFIDHFQDSTGLGTFTTSQRHASEYCESFVASYGAEAHYPAIANTCLMTTTNYSSPVTNQQVTSGGGGGDWWDLDGQVRSPLGHSGGSSATSIQYDFGAAQRWTALGLGKRQQHGDFNAGTISYSQNGSDWTGVDFTSWSGAASGDGSNYIISGASYYFSGTASGNGKVAAMSSSGAFNWNQFGTNAGAENAIKQKISGFTAFDARYLKIVMNSQHAAQNTNASIVNFNWYYTPAVGGSAASATGTIISTANVPSSAKTKVSGVMLYKDNAGTATLGTDLKVYFTCNGGSNWTETPSYTAVTPVFSAGIKMVKLGEATCTSGSDVRYKATWANQAVSSKETQLHGIGLNY